MADTETKVQTVKCIVCGRKRATREERFICHNCQQKIQAMGKTHRAEPPKYYLTYRGAVIGLFPIGDGNLQSRLLQVSAEHLPKSKTIDLNGWCAGFTRDKIKQFKATVLKLAAV